MKLRKITAWTVYSADSDTQSSEKGVYQERSLAEAKSRGSGWYGSNGEVREKTDVWQDLETGELYQVKCLGHFTDLEEARRKRMAESIKSKLTEEEIKFLNVKL